jgi:hypothetical protein
VIAPTNDLLNISFLRQLLDLFYLQTVSRVTFVHLLSTKLTLSSSTHHQQLAIVCYHGSMTTSTADFGDLLSYIVYSSRQKLV